MPIVSYPDIELEPREEVIAGIAEIIDDAACSGDDIDPHVLARQVFEYVNGKINSVDHDGKVIYRV